MILSVPNKNLLYKGILLKRRYRFFVDVEVAEKSVVTAYCANPGFMEGLIKTGAEVWLSKLTPKESRKLKWLWELVTVDNLLVSANSSIANKVVDQLLRARVLKGFKRYKTLSAEVKLSADTRIDFAVETKNSKHFIEVKNVNLVYPDQIAYFPDSHAKRSLKQVRELVKAVRNGHKATLILLVFRRDALKVRPSDLHDSVFAKAVRTAFNEGVNFRALLVEPKLSSYNVVKELPVDMQPYELDNQRKWKEERRPFGGWTHSNTKSKASSFK